MKYLSNTAWNLLTLKNQKPRGADLRVFVWVSGRKLLLNHHVRGLQALGAFFNRKLDFLALFQVPIAVALNRREMDENIFAAFPSDKAIALAPVKPFDCADNPF